MDLKTFSESIYNGSLSFKAAKAKQRSTENIIVKLDCYDSKKEKFKAHKESTLLNAREFYKGKRMIFNGFKNIVFPLPKQYSLGMDDWEEDDIDSSHFLPEKFGT